MSKLRTIERIQRPREQVVRLPGARPTGAGNDAEPNGDPQDAGSTHPLLLCGSASGGKTLHAGARLFAGLLAGVVGDDAPHELTLDEPGLAACYAAAAQG
jgi:hypothetical protein